MQFSHHNSLASALAKNVNAEARDIAESVTTIAGAASFEIIDQPLVLSHEVGSYLVDLSRLEDATWRVHRKLLERAMFFDDGWAADGEEKVGDARAALSHGSEERVEDLFGHNFYNYRNGISQKYADLKIRDSGNRPLELVKTANRRPEGGQRPLNSLDASADSERTRRWYRFSVLPGHRAPIQG